MQRLVRSIMTQVVNKTKYIQVEERVEWNASKLQQLRELNNITRKRAPHRKPPREKIEETSPIGVLQSFEIPKLLETHKLEIEELLSENFSKDNNEITIKDVENPVRDIINDAGVLDAFNSRIVKNVKILEMSAKGDGLAIIRAPSFATILECQEAANEREMIREADVEKKEEEKKDEKKDEEKKEGEEGSTTTEKKFQKRNTRKRPYRRTVEESKMPKIQIATVPFAFPGDVVNIRVYHTNKFYVDAEILKFVEMSDLRKGGDVKCAYFGICSGCQYQPVEYEKQLEIKREVVEAAYEHFCKDEVNWKGKVQNTVASPLQYGYRTKLTPHYDVPRSGSEGLGIPRLGFGWKGKGAWLKEEENVSEEWRGMRERSIRPYFGDVLDIEDCVIGTQSVRDGLIVEREKLEKSWKNGERSKKGSTILLREDFGKGCVTDPQAIITEVVDTGLGQTVKFEFVANEFFQNNRSILPKVISFVSEKLGNIKWLVDAYCGSGLFTVAIASTGSVEKVIGVEISERAVGFAKKNAELNGLTEDKCSFVWGKAEKLFEKMDFPGNETGVILDPPRKGCDELFLNQLSEFEPSKIVYVSCNVHSQARDVKFFINKTINGNKYEIETITGFDFFPQTHHVESVVVLQKKE